MIDRSRAAAAFDAYTSAYDPNNPRIALKIDHTLRVAQNCESIALAEGFDADLAWLCGLLHDIGRFEQVRRFDTFKDAESVSHAALGVSVLFEDEDPRGPQIRSFIEDAEHDALIRDVIATHSAYRLPATVDDKTRAYCNILRDADKIDIIKVNCICPIEDIYGVSQDAMTNSRLSPKVIATFYEHRTLPRSIRNYPADVLIGHICFAWELVYPSSRKLLVDQGYIYDMLSREFVLPKTQEQFVEMARHMRKWLCAEGETMNTRLQRQLDFALEIDKEKNVMRQTHLSGHGRRENDAEHAWHMAIMAWLLREYSNEEIDISRVMLMCLIHDVVEIDAGDTYAYDADGLKTQAEREGEAKQRIFGLLPSDQAKLLMELFDEFEAFETAESKFAHTMDNLQPVMLNNSNGGSDWLEHGVSSEQVYGRQRKSALGSKTLYDDVIKGIIERNIERGNIKRTQNG